MRRRSSSAACSARARDAATSTVRARKAASWRRRSTSGAGPGAEDLQRGELLGRELEPAGGDHGDVADRAAVGAPERERDVALEVVGAQERVARIAVLGVEGDAQQLARVRVLARRAFERELVALAELDPRRGGAGDRARMAGALLDQLGDERDLGVQRGAQLGNKPSQESAADDSRRAGREPAEEIAREGDVSRRHGNRAMLTRFRTPAQYG